MNSINKIIFFVIGLAIVLPLLYAGKFLRWLPPYGADSTNFFQVAGAQLARWSPLRPKIEPTDPQLATTNGETATSTSITPQEIKFIPPAKPYRIFLAGDSFMAVSGGFGDIAEQHLVKFAQTNVWRQGKVSSGLSRPDFYDWQAAAQIAIARHNPNITIVMMGTNDAQSFEIRENNNKRVIAFGTAQWDAEYQNRAESFIKKFTDSGTAVYWIGLPIMRNAVYDQKIRRLSQLQKNATKNNPQAKFISGAELMAGGDTAYQPFAPDENGVMRATRNPDGIHLSYFGGTILVDKIIEELKKDLDLSIPAPPQPAALNSATSTIQTKNPAQ